MTVRLLLDTDIGTYLDDALCLAYLLARDDCELMGITTVGGEAERRAQLAGTMCWAVGQAVPVFPGADEPLLAAPTLLDVPQAASMIRWPHQDEYPRGRAVEFLAGVIRAYPRQVSLLATGPATNVARLAELDPECMAMLRSLVLMGGVFGTELQATEPWERNSSADPHAWRATYTADVGEHRTVGLDVARRARLPAAEVLRRLRGELLGPVRDWAERWLRANEVVYWSDPLAAMCIFEDVCTFAPGAIVVHVVQDQGLTEGQGVAAEQALVGHASVAGTAHFRARTEFVPAADGPHQLAQDVDVGRFFALLWEKLG